MIEIPKANLSKTNYPCWIESRDPATNRLRRPEFKCMCGETVPLDDFHIHYDGLITGAYHHTTNLHCGFHALLKLMDWPHGIDFSRDN